MKNCSYFLLSYNHHGLQNQIQKIRKFLMYDRIFYRIINIRNSYLYFIFYESQKVGLVGNLVCYPFQRYSKPVKRVLGRLGRV